MPVFVEARANEELLREFFGGISGSTNILVRKGGSMDDGHNKYAGEVRFRDVPVERRDYLSRSTATAC